MRLPRIRAEALPYLAGLGLLSLVMLLMRSWFSLPALGLLLFVAFFFRDPDRQVRPSLDAILAPADGRIADVSEVFEAQFLKQTAVRVGIFLSLFDVHINRSPVDGRVIYLKYQRGKFRPAFRAPATLENERNLVGLEGQRGKVLVVQIAGILARRIECQVIEGDVLEAGQRFGMIRFGSRTELFVPEKMIEVLVNPGDYVKAGETVVGRWKSV
ncbi:MAG: phosphatidylserine decarboxylase [Chloroflexi bacterium]|nr:phosphatidylserine decarboxylase [Chloroflexota bacterium]